MPDEVAELCRFYRDQYGMIIQTMYNPIGFTLSCHIVFQNTRKDFSIMCAGLSDKEIAGHFHSIIYDVLAEEGRRQQCLI